MTNHETYHICWENKTTGQYGVGAGGLSKNLANKHVNRLNKQYPDIYHWIEKDGSFEPLGYYDE